MRKISFFDTTLRDGEQTPGVHLSVERKVDIARRLEKLGVDVIETGFPASSKSDFEATARIAGESGAVVCALARANDSDVKIAADALSGAKKPRIHVFIATSDIHLEKKLGITREEAIGAVKSSVSLAASFGAEVQFSAEDATRSDREFLVKIFTEAIRAGASVVNVPDTVGYAVPEEFAALITYLKENVPGADSVRWSVHCHDDLGLAVANSVAAVYAGADQVECTVNGIGERAGNAALEEIAMILTMRGKEADIGHGIVTREITSASRFVADVTGIRPAPNKAVVGVNAFNHASGIHQHGIINDRHTYEIMDPRDVGLDESTITLGKLSGRHAFAERAKALGYDLAKNGINAAFSRFKEIAEKKDALTDEDVRAIISEYLDGLEGKFRISSFQIQSGNKIKSMALITLSAGDEEYTEAAPGDGPVDASFNAVNKIAAPFIGGGDVDLLSYGITAVTEGADALGEAKVRIRSGEAVFTGRGVSTDIIKASIKAYLNAMNKLIAAAEEKGGNP
ncbi:MAG: 2-isopropylmalate synthase [Clostridia bacterium]|nr:2-isopropylmalate synthase [Clostridia bacterium]